ncbi:MAG: hypothetical protein H7338_04775 [Candidatus Sericytochromatia bacterium]|nr:hypothetical protein [Candidatus Sericytochromatia bacterium]
MKARTADKPADEQRPLCPHGFSIHPADHPVAPEDGQADAPLLPHWLRDRTFQLKIEPEKLLLPLAPDDQIVKGDNSLTVVSPPVTAAGNASNSPGKA